MSVPGQVTAADVVAWLGPSLPDTTPEQVEAIRVAWQAYYATPEVAGRTGEDADFAEQDQQVTSTIAQVILGDDVDLALLGRDLQRLAHEASAARRRLRATAIGATLAGMSEAEVATRAGIDRGTLRRMLGKQ